MSYTTSDVLSTGTETGTLSSSGTSTLTYAEGGNRTVSWGAGNTNSGAYAKTETSSQSYSDSTSSSTALGNNGTIASGVVSNTESYSYTDSYSDLETGTESVSDPESGPAFGGAFTQASISTAYTYSVDKILQNIGAAGTISGGGNSYSYIQQNSDSHSVTIITDTYDVVDSGTDTFSQNMAGTETYGSGGAITGGSDSFTWNQSASDVVTYYMAGGGTTTLGATPMYQMTIYDQISAGFYDVGTDILGASDTILGGCDTYTSYNSRNVDTQLTINGTAANPYSVVANGWDRFQTEDNGASTLTTDGHSLALDTIEYSEDSGNTASDAQSVGGAFSTGFAYDHYQNYDAATITKSDTLTTSWDSFTLIDTHHINGSMTSASMDVSHSESYSDTGSDDVALYAEGHHDTSGGSFVTFSNSESSADNFRLTETFYGQWNGTFSEDQGATNTKVGSSSNGPSGDSFAYVTSTTTQQTTTDSGTQTFFMMPIPFWKSTSATTDKRLSITGPPASTATVVDTGTSSSSSGGTEPTWDVVIGTQPGNGNRSGTGIVRNVGDFPTNAAVHNGTTQASLDTSEGVVSALGGQIAHPLAFVGSEITPTQTATAVVLQEANETVTTAPATIWSSHPSGIGYTRSTPPPQDSGTSDGSTNAELSRLQHFNGGAAEAPTSTQAAPTPRAHQASGGSDSWAGGGGTVDITVGPPSSPANGGGKKKPKGWGGLPGFDSAEGSNGLVHFPPKLENLPFKEGEQTHPPVLLGSNSYNPFASAWQWGQDKLNSAADAVRGARDVVMHPLKTLYTGDPNASDEVYNAAIEAAGSSYSRNARHAHKALEVIGHVPVAGALAGVADAALLSAEGNDAQAQDALLGAAISLIPLPGAKCGARGFRAAASLGMRAFGAYGAYNSACGAADDLQAAKDSWNQGDAVGVALNSASAAANVFDAIMGIRSSKGGCFAAGTPLLTPDGHKPIDELQVGDEVLSRLQFNPEGIVEARRVERVFVNWSPILELVVGGHTIRTTGEHPFWVHGAGWRSARQIHAGDQLIDHEGALILVEEVRDGGEPVTVYNLQVEEYHSYFVGCATWGFSVWAHNTGDSDSCGLKGKIADPGPPSNPKAKASSNVANPGPPSNPNRRAPAPDNYRGRYMADRNAQKLPRLPDSYDVHHRIPQKYMDHPELADYDFHQPSNLQGVKGSRSDLNTHQKITNDWEEFGHQNPNATRAQIEDFAKQMDAKYAADWF